MSLDVYLQIPGLTDAHEGSGIFIRENGQTVEISREEWDRRHPGVEPFVARVDDFYGDGVVYHANITHNLIKMANEAGLYKHLWRPDEIGITLAEQLIVPLQEGLARLKADPDRFKSFNPSNGWGDYEGLVQFVQGYLAACEANPAASVSVWE